MADGSETQVLDLKAGLHSWLTPTFRNLATQSDASCSRETAGTVKLLLGGARPWSRVWSLKDKQNHLPTPLLGQAPRSTVEEATRQSGQGIRRISIWLEQLEQKRWWQDSHKSHSPRCSRQIQHEFLNTCSRLPVHRNQAFAPALLA